MGSQPNLPASHPILAAQAPPLAAPSGIAHLKLLCPEHVRSGLGQHLLAEPGLAVDVDRAQRLAGQEFLVDVAGLLSQLGQEGQEKVKDMAQTLIPPCLPQLPLPPTCWVSLAGICWKRSQAFQKVTFSALNSFFRNS